ncbi:MAG: TIGR01212 family radical SAM protein [Rikenellaceae bacterium]
MVNCINPPENERVAPPAEFNGRRFNSYSAHFKRIFGERMQKVTINAGFTCPNRDGVKGVGGCSFCNNEAFTPSYCTKEKSVAQQINEGIEFHTNRYRKATRYLAYFQSFSNTYAPLSELKKLYDQALDNPLIAGLIIGTRPDCVDEEKLDYFAQLSKSKYVTLEYGVESTYDSILERINRGHDFATAKWAIEQSAQRGIDCGAHFILGLPGENEKMLHHQIDTINSLPITMIKFHQLQIFKGTTMAQEWLDNPSEFHFWSLEEYIDIFISLLERLRPDIIVERFASEAPPRYHLGPTWGLIRNESILSKFEKRLEELDTFQGRLY